MKLTRWFPSESLVQTSHLDYLCISGYGLLRFGSGLFLLFGSVRASSSYPVRFGSPPLSGSVRISSSYPVRVSPPIRFGSDLLLLFGSDRIYSSYPVRIGSPPPIRFGSDLLLLSGSDRVFFLTGSENLQLFPASYFRRTTAFSTILNFLWHYKTFQTAVTTYRINHKH